MGTRLLGTSGGGGSLPLLPPTPSCLRVSSVCVCGVGRTCSAPLPWGCLNGYLLAAGVSPLLGVRWPARRPPKRGKHGVQVFWGGLNVPRRIPLLFHCPQHLWHQPSVHLYLIPVRVSSTNLNTAVHASKLNVKSTCPWAVKHVILSASSHGTACSAVCVCVCVCVCVVEQY